MQGCGESFDDELHVLDGILQLLPQDEMVCLKHGVMAMLWATAG